MEDIAVVGVDLAKSVFQVHGIDARGQVVLRRKLSRSKLLSFFATLPRCRNRDGDLRECQPLGA